jgi:hypothetical protein
VFAIFNRIGAIFLRVLVSLAVAFAAAPAIAGSRYALRVDGLACPFCAYGKGEVVIEMVDGKALDPAAAERAVKKAGFKLRGLEPAKSR